MIKLEVGQYYKIANCEDPSKDIYKAVPCDYSVCEQHSCKKIKLDAVNKLDEAWVCWPACQADGWYLFRRLTKQEVALEKL